MIPRFFLGTTDETTRAAESCPCKILVTRSAVKMAVAIFEARPIREREAKASLVNELLTSMSKNSVAGFLTDEKWQDKIVPAKICFANEIANRGRAA